MGHGNIKGRGRYLDFVHNDIALSIIGFHGLGSGRRFCPVAYLVHSPKYLFQKFFFSIIHRGDFLWIIRVSGSFHGIDCQHFGPDSTGAGQFQAVMCGAALNFSQLALVFQVDLPDNGGHGLARAAVLTRKEDAKGRGGDQANQADHHNGKDGNPSSGGDSGHQRLNGRKQGLCRSGCAFCSGFCGGGGGLCCDTGGLGGRSRGSGCDLRRLCRMVCCFDGGFRRAWSSLGGMLGSFYRSLGALDGVLRTYAGVLRHSLGGLLCRFYGEFRLPGHLRGV